MCTATFNDMKKRKSSKDLKESGHMSFVEQYKRCNVGLRIKPEKLTN